ncbi:Ankyrin repeat protein 3 [Giardia duodenalis]|uniref:Ankyrin repeat protein 3 n=1 Tax=Giardia intestinalis (strain ATCC 50803 / WB clone C6) TaxID=184922 RepID=A0A644F8Z4_GIAIC|nr:Ankyrin repeat protein 3 [Giardia intestinalis]KAE8305151.1 Ankyrin repeat protein 3 [Giardia intestinalis]
MNAPPPVIPSLPPLEPQDDGSFYSVLEATVQIFPSGAVELISNVIRRLKEKRKILASFDMSIHMDTVYECYLLAKDLLFMLPWESPEIKAPSEQAMLIWSTGSSLTIIANSVLLDIVALLYNTVSACYTLAASNAKAIHHSVGYILQAANMISETLQQVDSTFSTLDGTLLNRDVLQALEHFSRALAMDLISTSPELTEEHDSVTRYRQQASKLYKKVAVHRSQPDSLVCKGLFAISESILDLADIRSDLLYINIASLACTRYRAQNLVEENYTWAIFCCQRLLGDAASNADTDIREYLAYAKQILEQFVTSTNRCGTKRITDFTLTNQDEVELQFLSRTSVPVYGTCVQPTLAPLVCRKLLMDYSDKVDTALTSGDHKEDLRDDLLNIYQTFADYHSFKNTEYPIDIRDGMNCFRELLISTYGVSLAPLSMPDTDFSSDDVNEIRAQFHKLLKERDKEIDRLRNLCINISSSIPYTPNHNLLDEVMLGMAPTPAYDIQSSKMNLNDLLLSQPISDVLARKDDEISRLQERLAAQDPRSLESEEPGAAARIQALEEALQARDEELARLQAAAAEPAIDYPALLRAAEEARAADEARHQQALDDLRQQLRANEQADRAAIQSALGRLAEKVKENEGLSKRLEDAVASGAASPRLAQTTTDYDALLAEKDREIKRLQEALLSQPTGDVLAQKDDEIAQLRDALSATRSPADGLQTAINQLADKVQDNGSLVTQLMGNIVQGVESASAEGELPVTIDGLTARIRALEDAAAEARTDAERKNAEISRLQERLAAQDPRSLESEEPGAAARIQALEEALQARDEELARLQAAAAEPAIDYPALLRAAEEARAADEARHQQALDDLRQQLRANEQADRAAIQSALGRLAEKVKENEGLSKRLEDAVASGAASPRLAQTTTDYDALLAEKDREIKRLQEALLSQPTGDVLAQKDDEIAQLRDALSATRSPADGLQTAINQLADKVQDNGSLVTQLMGNIVQGVESASAEGELPVTIDGLTARIRALEDAAAEARTDAERKNAEISRLQERLAAQDPRSLESEEPGAAARIQALEEALQARDEELARLQAAAAEPAIDYPALLRAAEEARAADEARHQQALDDLRQQLRANEQADRAAIQSALGRLAEKVKENEGLSKRLEDAVASGAASPRLAQTTTDYDALLAEKDREIKRLQEALLSQPTGDVLAQKDDEIAQLRDALSATRSPADGLQTAINQLADKVQDNGSLVTQLMGNIVQGVESASAEGELPVTIDGLTARIRALEDAAAEARTDAERKNAEISRLQERLAAQDPRSLESEEPGAAARIQALEEALQARDEELARLQAAAAEPAIDYPALLRAAEEARAADEARHQQALDDLRQQLRANEQADRAAIQSALGRLAEKVKENEGLSKRLEDAVASGAASPRLAQTTTDYDALLAEKDREIKRLQEALLSQPTGDVLAQKDDEIAQLRDALSATRSPADGLQTAINQLADKVQDNGSLVTQLMGNIVQGVESASAEGELPVTIDGLTARIRALEDAAAEARTDAERKNAEISRLQERLAAQDPRSLESEEPGAAARIQALEEALQARDEELARLQAAAAEPAIDYPALLRAAEEARAADEARHQQALDDLRQQLRANEQADRAAIQSALGRLAEKVKENEGLSKRLEDAVASGAASPRLAQTTTDYDALLAEKDREIKRLQEALLSQPTGDVLAQKDDEIAQLRDALSATRSPADGLQTAINQLADKVQDNGSLVTQLMGNIVQGVESASAEGELPVTIDGLTARIRALEDAAAEARTDAERKNAEISRLQERLAAQDPRSLESEEPGAAARIQALEEALQARDEELARLQAAAAEPAIDYPALLRAAEEARAADEARHQQALDDLRQQLRANEQADRAAIQSALGRLAEKVKENEGLSKRLEDAVASGAASPRLAQTTTDYDALLAEKDREIKRLQEALLSQPTGDVLAQKDDEIAQLRDALSATRSPADGLQTAINQLADKVQDNGSLVTQLMGNIVQGVESASAEGELPVTIDGLTARIRALEDAAAEARTDAERKNAEISRLQERLAAQDPRSLESEEPGAAARIQALEEALQARDEELARLQAAAAEPAIDYPALLRAAEEARAADEARHQQALDDLRQQLRANEQADRAAIQSALGRLAEKVKENEGLSKRLEDAVASGAASPRLAQTTTDYDALLAEKDREIKRLQEALLSQPTGDVLAQKDDEIAQLRDALSATRSPADGLQTAINQLADKVQDNGSLVTQLMGNIVQGVESASAEGELPVTIDGLTARIRALEDAAAEARTDAERKNAEISRLQERLAAQDPRSLESEEPGAAARIQALEEALQARDEELARLQAAAAEPAIDYPALLRAAEEARAADEARHQQALDDLRQQLRANEQADRAAIQSALGRLAEKVKENEGLSKRLEDAVASGAASPRLAQTTTDYDALLAEKDREIKRLQEALLSQPTGDVLAQKDDEIAQLRDALSATRSPADGLQTAINQLADKVQDNGSLVTQLMGNIVQGVESASAEGELPVTIDGLTARIRALEDAAAEARTDAERKNAEISRLQERLAAQDPRSLESEEPGAAARIQALEEALQARDEELARLQAAAAEPAIDYPALLRAAEEARAADEARHQQALDDLRQQLRANEQADRAAIQSALGRLAEKVKENEGLSKRLEDAVASGAASPRLAQTTTDYDALLAEKDREIKRLQEALLSQPTGDVLAQKDDEIAQLRDALSATRSPADGLQTAINQLADKVQDNGSLVTQLMGNIVQGVESASAEGELPVTIDGLTARIRALEDAAAEARTDAERKNAEISRLQERLAAQDPRSLESEEPGAAARIQALEEALQARDEELARLQAAAAEPAIDYPALLRAAEEARAADEARHQQALDDLRQQLRANEQADRAAIQSALGRLAEKVKENEGLSKRLEDAVASGAASPRLAQTTTDYDALLAEKDREIKRLQEALLSQPTGDVLAQKVSDESKPVDDLFLATHSSSLHDRAHEPTLAELQRELEDLRKDNALLRLTKADYARSNINPLSEKELKDRVFKYKSGYLRKAIQLRESEDARLRLQAENSALSSAIAELKAKQFAEPDKTNPVLPSNGLTLTDLHHLGSDVSLSDALVQEVEDLRGEVKRYKKAYLAKSQAYNEQEERLQGIMGSVGYLPDVITPVSSPRTSIPNTIGQQVILTDLVDWYGNTRLMQAVALGNEADIKAYLIQSGKQNRDGWSALMFAAQQGNMRAVKLLIDKEADLVRNDGMTAYKLAVENGHTEIANLLKTQTSTWRGC